MGQVMLHPRHLGQVVTTSEDSLFSFKPCCWKIVHLCFSKTPKIGTETVPPPHQPMSWNIEGADASVYPTADQRVGFAFEMYFNGISHTSNQASYHRPVF